MAVTANEFRYVCCDDYLSLSLSLSLSSKHFVGHAGRATRYAKAKSLLVIHSLRTNLRRCGLKPNMSPLLITKFICLIMYFSM